MRSFIKNIVMSACALASFAAVLKAAEAVPCLTEAEAQSAADSIYVKSVSFADTVLESRKNYEAWQKKQLAFVNENVKFGRWYVSSTLGGNSTFSMSNPSAAVTALDPVVNPFKADEIYDGSYIWNKVTLNYGAVNIYADANPRYLANSVNFIYCELEAAKDVTVGATLSGMSKTVLYLNSEKVAAETAGFAMCKPMFAKLKLKKGKNVLVVRVQPAPSKDVPRIYFTPYADPAIFLGAKLIKDYKNFYDLISRWEAKPDVRIASFFADADFKNSLFEILNNAVICTTLSGAKIDAEYAALKSADTPAADPAWIKLFGKVLETIVFEDYLEYDPASVVAAVKNLTDNFAEYPKDLLPKALDWQKRLPAIIDAYKKGDDKAAKDIDAFKKFARDALILNPLLQKTNTWVFVKRDPASPAQGLPANWQGNHALKKNIKPDQRWLDELWEFKVEGDKVTDKLLFKPEDSKGVLDLEVDWDAKKIMFSSLTKKNNFQLFEIDADGKNLRMLSPEIYENVDNFDGVYLPDGRVIFCSTAPFVGVPCVSGTDYVANLFVMNQNAGDPAKVDKTIRQLTFEQDADWMPTVMHNGRIMYTRWEYTDNSHYFSRILMHMNPDGTAQSSYYGSTSYWPNSLFYVRQVPNEPNKFVGIVSGHHGTRRAGELHMFDVSKGTVEAEGEIHNFLSRGREFKPEILDKLVDDKWPHFLHPYPLSENYVVAAMRDRNYEWGIYLVDTFGNATLLTQTKYRMSLEPMPLVLRERPPQIADRTNPDTDKGYVFLTDIYQGPGLKDVPRGTVKALRVFEYYYCYREMGSHDAISQEGAWDVKRVYGTVPVEDDGSAMFEVPANRPIAIQPLDKDGKALALMRSWFVVMPGEVQSCVGCHEGQGMTPTTAPAKAGRKAPSKIKPFRGPVRGYSFIRDVQPILEKYCLDCHNGQAGRPNFSRNQPVGFRNFPQSYLNLHPYVRRTGPESNQHLLTPLEFHADTSELIQLLKKGHKGVNMSKEDLEVLVTWIDLNVPARGTWEEFRPIPDNGHELRKETLAKYAKRTDDPEIISYDPGVQEFVKPAKPKKHEGKAPTLEGFPFDAQAAAAKQAAAKLPKEILIDLGGKQTLRLVLIPAGEFVMGTNSAFFDEGPAQIAKIEKPFYLGQFEVSNAQYNAFDPKHDSGHLDRQWKDHVNPGYPANEPDQSVIRVSFNDAQAFCKWLTEKTGVQISLPTETQWEWAARGGTDTPFYFGNKDSDFSVYENLADIQVKKFAVFGVDPQPVPNPIEFNAFTPADYRFNDGALVHVAGGRYMANPFGLYDMLGNVCEWTQSPYSETLGGAPVEDKMVVRGGSWRDRPKWARATLRKDYRAWQKVYNVGFRIAVDDAEKAARVFKAAPALPAKELKSIPILKDTLDTSLDREKLVRPASSRGNLLFNGDFETPPLKKDGANIISRGEIPAWQSNMDTVEIWAEGALNSPKLNSKGAATGQHLEIASSGYAPFNVFQEVLIPSDVKDSTATLSFEAWARANTKSGVQVSVNGKVVLDELLKNGASAKWTPFSYKIPHINAGDRVKVNFYEMGNGVSWHVDNASLVLDLSETCAPNP